MSAARTIGWLLVAGLLGAGAVLGSIWPVIAAGCVAVCLLERHAWRI